MKRRGYVVLAALLALGIGIAVAQEKKDAKSATANGVVTAVSNGSLSIEAGKKSMTFAVVASTVIKAVGAGTKTREQKAAGKAGISITDAVGKGDQVTVRYSSAEGKMVALEVQVRTKGKS